MPSAHGTIMRCVMCTCAPASVVVVAVILHYGNPYAQAQAAYGAGAYRNPAAGGYADPYASAAAMYGMQGAAAAAGA
ncbi:hypothetical protein I4F81_001461 [Pyropia yezoensis]|uniref:Uncharacterized protein n=1 Tax=Pyropia yezoensis TaxID=2788 RepID=A0ACC3BMZ9_PYRYE|nr:hypothetical protein I4F81_001461 [Neopyropia yezoensis]